MTPNAGNPVYFDDYRPGMVVDLGSVSVSEAEVVEFGRRYDPQPFHVDAAAAADGPFGGLIASGWQTCGLTMTRIVGQYLSPLSSLGSPGIDELRWGAPVRPGDELLVRASVLTARVSSSKPDRGIVQTRIETVNHQGVLVLSMIAINLIRRAP